MRAHNNKDNLYESDNWKHDRVVVSFRINKSLWIEFDELITERYGNYKKSFLIENLIKKYMIKQKNNNYLEGYDL